MPTDQRWTAENDILLQIISEAPPARRRRQQPAADGLIRADTTVAEAIRRFPDAAAVFKRYGLNCPACANSQVETVESVSASLQAPLRELLQELNLAARAARRPLTKAR